MGKNGGNKGFESFVQSIMSRETKPHKKEGQLTKSLPAVEQKVLPVTP